MKTKILLFSALVAAGTLVQAQLSIPTTGVPVTVNFTGYTGRGFDTAPSAGKLDADNWAVTGMSDGDRTYGSVDTLFGGDFAKGVTTGDITSGGLYAYDNGGNTALLIQPTSTDWTPGTLTLRLQNNTGGSIAELAVAYDLIVLNNEDRSNSFNFSYSTDDITYNPVSSLDYVSVELQDPLGTPVTVPKSTTLTGLSVINGGFIYLRWSGDDLTGGGSRDEFALDNISATASAGGTVSAFNFGAASLSVGEGSGPASVSLTLSSSATCSVDIVAANVTATNGVDYTAPAVSTRNFTAGGATSVNINIPIADDMLLEGPETFTLTLQNATAGCIVGAVSTTTITIEDNDVAAFGECANLYISEYVEGSSNNKALEIYNPTGSAVDLSGYSVKAFNNGATIPTNSIFLSGTLAAGDVYVIANPSADSLGILSVADTTSTVTFYNGDDAIILFNGGDTIDAIGIVGVDPGTNWAVGTGATSEWTLVRKPEVKGGQKNWAIGATEWLVFTVDDFSNLGSHTQDPCPLTCNSAIVPTGQTHTTLSNRVQLNWTPTPGAVACQVQGKRLPTGPQPSVNLLSAPINTTNVPFAIAGAGTTWTWRVRCACSITPLDVSAYSVYGDTFSIPVAREAALEDLTVYPNPASDQLMVAFAAEQDGNMAIEITDMLGRTVLATPFVAQTGMNNTALDVNGLEPGLYFVRVDGRQTAQFSVAR